MANVIKHKRGSGSDPSASNLVIGELAIRTDNGKLFTKMDSGAIAEIAGGGSDIAINTLSSSSATGGGSATFNGSAYRFTLSSPPSVSAAQLLVSVNGVIQKPVAGTGQPSEGFSVDGNDIIFGDAPATGADFFILTFRSLGVSEPADNSVTSAKIVDGAIVNADINASAAIAGTKISPDFGSQNIVTTGVTNLSGELRANGNIRMTNASPKITFVDDDNNPDFEIGNLNGLFRIRDATNTTNRLVIDSSGNVGIGTASPTKKLTVFGTGAGEATLQIEGEGGADPYINFLANNTQHWSAGIDDSDNDSFKIAKHSALGTNDYFVVTTAGKVGIGTTSPVGRLTVDENNASQHFQLRNTTNTSNFAAFGLDTSFNLRIYTNGQNERMRIDSSGRVLIGTTNTTPAASNVPGIVFGDNTAGTATAGIASFCANGAAPLLLTRRVSDGNVLGIADDAGTKGVLGVTSNDLVITAVEELRFSTGVGKVERIRLTNAGRLGIGLTGPASALHVKSSSGTQAVFESTGSDNASVQFKDSTTTDSIIVGALNNDLQLRCDPGNIVFKVANNQERLRLTSTGVLQLRDSSGNVKMSFENSGSLNFITSNSGQEIKVSSGLGDANGIEFWDYTGVNKRCQIDGHGIKFNSDTAAANALDDYEEGTFSPAWFDDGGGFVSSYGRQYGQYTKIGNVVYFTIGLRINSFSRTPNSGQACRIGNLPFVSRVYGDDEEAQFSLYARLWGNGTPPEAAWIRQSSGGSGSNHVELYMSESQTGNDHILLGADFPNNSQPRVVISGFYHVS